MHIKRIKKSMDNIERAQMKIRTDNCLGSSKAPSSVQLLKLPEVSA